MKGKVLSSSRRQQVLRAIVEDYVSLREPVGSKALIERHNLKVSSATIRNDMAALEEEGLITAPHASAGRIPTEKGYRFFVDQISSPRPLSAAEKRAIHRLLDTSESVEQVYEGTVRVLSQLTHQAAILQYPTAPVDKIRHLELIPLSDFQVTLMLISDRGQVLQRIAAVPRYSLEELEELRSELLKRFVGQPVSTLTEQLDGAQGSFRQAVGSALIHFATEVEPAKLLIAGTSYLAQSNADFSSSVAPILDALEEQVTMLRLLSEMAEDARGVSVRIGTENTAVPLSEASIVASAYGSDSSALIGVIGPTRMDYPHATSAVRGVARYLSKILGQ